jgi:hypothetical protein
MTAGMNVIFGDLETVDLDPGPGSIWEVAIICRDDPDHRDHEYVWHLKPDLSNRFTSNGGAAGIGGYYERCHAQRLDFGEGAIIHNSAWPRGKSLAESPFYPASVPVDATPVAARSIAGTLARMLAGATLVGANFGSFDAPHVDAFLRANGHILAADYHYIDIGSLVRGWAHGKGITVPDGPLKLNGALILAGLEPGHYDAHKGLHDARACRDIWDVVTGS